MVYKCIPAIEVGYGGVVDHLRYRKPLRAHPTPRLWPLSKIRPLLEAS